MNDEPPPIFSSWNGWYALLIGVLALLVLLCTLFTRYYS
ncbi:MAG: hypothetical protein ACI9X4_000819 [Glaciecola sp.]|jgi:hypothetical protein